MKKSKIAVIIIAVVVVAAVVIGSLLVGVYNGFLKPQSFNDYIVPSSGDNTGNYRYCYEELSDSEKKLYSVILPQLYSQSERIEVPQLADGDLNSVFKALSYDNPDLFNLGLNCKMYSSGYKYFFETEYAIDNSTYKSRLQEVEDIAAVITEGANKFTSQYEKEKYVHDYIINHCTYVEPSASENASNIYGCLVEGKAACEGYSRAFQYILNKLNIPNRLVTGEGATDGVNYIAHMWNLVYIENKPYFVDVTWDDPKSESSIIRHTYFNVTTEEIFMKHRNIAQTLPLCSDTEHNYFIMEGAYIEIGSGEAFETAVSNAVFNAQYQQQESVELRFPDGVIMEQAKNSLFNSGVIYNVYTDAGIFLSSGSGQVYYITDDAMNTICLFF